MTAYLLTKNEILALKANNLNRLIAVSKPQPAPFPGGGLSLGLWLLHKKHRYRVTEPQSDFISSVCPFGQSGEVIRLKEALARGKGGKWFYSADGWPVRMERSNPRFAEMVSWAHHRENVTCPAHQMPDWAVRFRPVIRSVLLLSTNELSYREYETFVELYGEIEEVNKHLWVWVIYLESKN